MFFFLELQTLLEVIEKLCAISLLELYEGRSSQLVIYANFAVAKRKPEKSSGFYGIRTPDSLLEFVSKRPVSRKTGLSY